MINNPTFVTPEELLQTNRLIFTGKHLACKMHHAEESGDFETWLECKKQLHNLQEDHKAFWDAICNKYDLVPDYDCSIDGVTGELECKEPNPLKAMFGR
jgi:hypothetical protein